MRWATVLGRLRGGKHGQRRSEIQQAPGETAMAALEPIHAGAIRIFVTLLVAGAKAWALACAHAADAEHGRHDGERADARRGFLESQRFAGLDRFPSEARGRAAAAADRQAANDRAVCG